MTLLIDGQLEIDQERGVIYFHSNQTGTTPLRICSLPTPIPDPRWIITNGAVKQTGKALDITHMYGANWGSDLENHYRNRVDPIKLQNKERILKDDDGYSSLLWDKWGKKMGMKDTAKGKKGTLLYIPDDLILEDTPEQKEALHYHDKLKDYWMNINGGNER